MTSVEGLLSWLRAQLDEDERAAREASDSTVIGEPGHWRPAPGGDEWAVLSEGGYDMLLVALRPGRMPADLSTGLWGQVTHWEDDHTQPGVTSPLPSFKHAARWDPARVLAEVDAKRRILDLHRPVAADDVPGLVQCGFCHGEVMPCRHMRLLALPMAGREGYQEGWRP